jgi:hypothetical protein
MVNVYLLRLCFSLSTRRGPMLLPARKHNSGQIEKTLRDRHFLRKYGSKAYFVQARARA